MGAVFALIAAFVNWFPLITGLTITPKGLKIQFFYFMTSSCKTPACRVKNTHKN